MCLIHNLCQKYFLTSKQDVVPLVDRYLGCLTALTHFWRALFMIEIYKLMQSSDN